MNDSYKIRRIILNQSKRANVGHIGSALSVADIIAVLYSDILNVADPKDPHRDRFILSKGHAALALYGAFFLKGWLTEEELDTYCTDNSLLGVHPEHHLKGVDFSTGSLGHGLPMATGVALAAQMVNASYRSFVLISDAELNEGSVWESIMFAAQHRLSKLVVILDYNRQQAFGYTKDVLDLDPLDEKLISFGWDVHTVDGHNTQQLTEVISRLNTLDGPPHFVIANTTFGKGVSFMQNKIKWHYWPMSDEQYKTALEDIEKEQ